MIVVLKKFKTATFAATVDREECRKGAALIDMELKELIAIGSRYYNKDCICSAELWDAFSYEYPEISLSSNAKNSILKKLGYMLFPERITIRRKTRQVWVKKAMSKKEIRKNLDEYYEFMNDI